MGGLQQEWNTRRLLFILKFLSKFCGFWMFILIDTFTPRCPTCQKLKESFFFYFFFLGSIGDNHSPNLFLHNPAEFSSAKHASPSVTGTENKLLQKSF